MKYMLKTTCNVRGTEVFSKSKEGNTVVYEVIDRQGKWHYVPREWVLGHKHEIVNLGVTSNERFYVTNSTLTWVWTYFYLYYGGDGKASINRALYACDLNSLNELKKRGYDGIIINNAPIGNAFSPNRRIIQQEIIAFYPNQIKSIDNKYPTTSPSIYEKKQLLNGKKQNRGLSEEQKVYFKDSKIRNKNGSLMICYHCTEQQFDAFDITLVGSGHGACYGDGFYFSSEPIPEYGRTIKVYLNIKKPYVINNVNDFNEELNFLKTCGFKNNMEYFDG